MTFPELGLAQPILRAVAASGYETPTPIQAQAIPHVLAGKDLLGCAQTGTGKTAAFALPILHCLLENPPGKGQGRRIRALILSPTRELASQIGDSFATYGNQTPLRHTVIFGGVSQFHQVKALKNGVDILVATPGRLLDLMQQGFVDLRSVNVFVLDEADRMLDMGFLPDVNRIVSKVPNERQTVLFSATMPPAIEELADEILQDPVRVKIAPVRATTELVEHSVCHVPQKIKSTLLAALIKARAVSRAIVFTRTKHGADRVTRQLIQSGIRAEAIHGNKSQSARQKTLANFKSKRPPVLVATDIAARGIDVDGVSHVFNYDLPHEAETYVHRIGRTGRAGASGIAVSFCDREERKFLIAIERLIRKTLQIEKDLPIELPPMEPMPSPARAKGPAGGGQQRRRGPGGRPNHQGAASGGRPRWSNHGKRPNKKKPARPSRPAAN